MNGEFIGIGIFLAGQLIVVVVWGAQMEMRMRAMEKVAEQFYPMRDDVRDLKKDTGNILSTMKDLAESFRRIESEDRSFRPRRHMPSDT